MAKWFAQVSQWHQMYCHDLEVISSNSCQWGPHLFDKQARLITSLASKDFHRSLKVGFICIRKQNRNEIPEHQTGNHSAPDSPETFLSHVVFLSQWLLLFRCRLTFGKHSPEDETDIKEYYHWAKKHTIQQLTTMLSSPKNVLFPGHNQLLVTAQAIIKVSGHQHRWFAGGYDLEIGHF